MAPPPLTPQESGCLGKWLSLELEQAGPGGAWSILCQDPRKGRKEGAGGGRGRAEGKAPGEGGDPGAAPIGWDARAAGWVAGPPGRAGTGSGSGGERPEAVAGEGAPGRWCALGALAAGGGASLGPGAGNQAGRTGGGGGRSGDAGPGTHRCRRGRSHRPTPTPAAP